MVGVWSSENITDPLIKGLKKELVEMTSAGMSVKLL